METKNDVLYHIYSNKNKRYANISFFCFYIWNFLSMSNFPPSLPYNFSKTMWHAVNQISNTILVIVGPFFHYIAWSNASPKLVPSMRVANTDISNTFWLHEHYVAPHNNGISAHIHKKGKHYHLKSLRIWEQSDNRFLWPLTRYHFLKIDCHTTIDPPPNGTVSSKIPCWYRSLGRPCHSGDNIVPV